ncbi:hypothetical protein CQ007_00950 [Pseudomonas sp. MYb185]|nr:hypothetical protein CQ007_00950 [Pseudomonas sp. MYb185]
MSTLSIQAWPTQRTCLDYCSGALSRSRPERARRSTSSNYSGTPPLPDHARRKYKKARNYAGLAAFYAISCLAVPDAGSLPLNRRRRLAGDIVGHP